MRFSAIQYTFPTILLMGACLFFPGVAEAATLHIAPGTGVYSAGGTFTTRVTINTAGQKVNAAEGQLSFNPREISVVSVTRAGSIFNLWTEEPGFSNGAGTISFGGGSPTGYSGSNGTVLSVTFRAVAAGSPKVNFTNGSVLAADGLGTNVLTSMSGATYTINAPAENPEPEYIAPANTPAAPSVTSRTHPDPNGWYRESTAELSWSLPGDVTAVRTLLDESAGTIPTIVYDSPISSRTIEDLPQGISYFHIQFRNAEGWGRVTHYRLAVDSESPKAFVIREAEEQDPEKPEKELLFEVEDISPVTRYVIQIDGGEAIEYNDEDETGRYTLPSLAPGRHTVSVEAFDSAGNSLIATYAFDITSFSKPIFTDYPTRINNEVIPVIKGSTRPNSTVLVTTTNQRGEDHTYEMKSDENGTFTFIPDNPFDRGVYELVAVAIDEFGARSEPSDPIRIVVDEPGYLKIGSMVVSILSVVIPFVALLLLLIFGVWYLWHKLSVWRRDVVKETKEAEQKLAVEFNTITANLAKQVEKLKQSRKGKLTKAEEALIDELRSDIESARRRIHKEISDIDDVVE
jgi:hypothetical protein